MKALSSILPTISRTFLLCLMANILATTKSNATEEIFSGGLQRQQLLVAGASFEVSDTFPAVVDQLISVKDMIRFYIDEDTLLKTAVFTHWVEVSIEKYDANNTLIGTETAVRFTVKFDPAEGVAYRYGYIYEFANVHRIKVTITNKSASFPAYMRLEGKITVNRKYPFDCAVSPALLQKTHADLLNTSTNALQVGWQKQAGAEEYDLEWGFYDTLSPTITLASGSNTNFDFIFRNNATRISTGQTWYNIPLAYPKGRIYWRVRGVRYKNGAREMGKWSSLKASSTTLVIRQEWYWVSPHEQGFNWQMQSVFAEEGKKTQSITYFDGSLRNRQNVVRSDAINMIVASETIYDSLGRAAIQVMPAPVSFGTGVNDWTRGIKFTPSFSAAQGKLFYSAVDFNFNSGNCNLATNNPAAKMDSTNSSVARYYSSNNPWKNRLINKFTPASEGYPFSVTEYMPDGTGRVRRQGGVGPSFQLGSGHETKYFYAKPEQTELDRLFGNEAGHSDHYQKNGVMDPNGQMSVSYVDAHGRTVATALAGIIDTNQLRQLPNTATASRLTTNLLENVRDGLALTSTYSLLVSNESNSLMGEKDTFIYTFYPNLELSINSCLPVTRCYDCKYDLEIKVLKECGDVVVNFSKSNFTAGQFDTLCNVLPDTILRIFQINPGLKVGQYQVTKTLKVNQQALDYYANDYVNHLTCIPDVNTLQNGFLGDTSCNKTCQECHMAIGDLPAFRTKYLQGVPSPTPQDIANADSAYYRAHNNCNELCDQGNDSDCAIMYEMMLNDVSPGGQYAEYSSTVGPDPDGDFTYGPSTDPTSMFHLAAGQTEYPFQRIDLLDGGTLRYLNEFGQVDYIDRPDSTRIRIDSLTINEFITYFKPSWAKALVKAHPEYCLYLCCKANSNPVWDSTFSSVTTYAQAVANGYLPISNLIANDPFLMANQTQQDSMELIWSNYTSTSFDQCGTPISLTELLISVIYCGGDLPCNVTPGDSCTADNDLYWQIVQSHYLSELTRLKKNKMLSGNCPPPNPSNSFCRNYGQLCFGKTVCGTANPNPYQSKTPRIFFQPAPPTGEAALDELYNMIDSVQTNLTDVCDTTCSAMARQWIEKLAATCATISGATQANLDSLQNRFIAVCKSGCDVAHPFGAITTNGQASSYGDLSLQDAITAIFPLLNSCDENCSGKLIDFPGTFTAPKYLAPPLQASAFDSCRCARIEVLNNCWASIGQPSLLAYINSSSNVTLTQAQLDELDSSCTSECHFMSQAIKIPPILECNSCKTLTQVKAEFDAFFAGCGDTTTVAKKNLMAAHLNQYFGLNRSYDDYAAFVVTGPQTNPGCRYLCPSNTFSDIAIDSSCVSHELEEATFTMANLSYQSLLDSMRREFVKKYLGKCLGSELIEQFESRTSQKEYHYTLYYYDQAGNLVRTVPPKGVVLLTGAELTAVKNHRTNPANPAKYPLHNLNTRYWYNSLSQVVRDSTPDRGVSDYWYDRLGRLVLSQNAKQKPLNDYSYTLFDFLGRAVESGRIRKDAAGLATLGTIWNYTDFNTWLSQNAVGRFEVTETYYDDILPGSSAALSPFFPNADGTNGQVNLRNRIATVTFSDTKDGDPLTYNFATHYSYDIGGNVKQMLQDIPELNISTSANHRYKRISYDYDLISGKVNAVYYQKDSTDQFIHRYAYDADNRLQFVETSRDGFNWERDANYEYYLHGPLGRMELGERRVQGLDYAYTLQGWLKGVNASALSLASPNTANFSTKDMGLDGKSGNTEDFARNKVVARDVIGFTLGYFYGDYRKVNTVATDNFELKYAANADFNTASLGLFNGNIRHAVYAIARLNETGTGVNAFGQPEGFNYKYDQLNRLVKQRNRVNYTLSSFVWGTTPAERSHFREDVSYDPNGNILTYFRQGAVATQYLMDKLVYNYQANNNKLSHIDDLQTNQTTYVGDLEDQNPNNYQYDNIGNLIQDNRDSVNLITWTNAQKIDSIIKTDRSIRFKYDAMQNRVVKYSKPNSSNIEKRTYYIRDAQGNVMATYAGFVKNNAGVITWDSLRLAEQHIYGSARLGMALSNTKFYPTAPKNPHLPDTSHYAIYEGWKRYELSNHLGNVLATITDRKRGKAVSGTAIQWFDADVVSAQQYYPFGMLMPGNASVLQRRQYTLGSNDYRYGFNGKEGDDEVKGDDNQQDYGMRIYDPRAGKFLSVDPIAKSYPWYTPYQFAGNQPIWSIDLDGLEEKHYQAVFDYTSGKTTLNYMYQEDIITNHLKRSEMSEFGVFSREVSRVTVNDYEKYVVHGKSIRFLMKEGVDPIAREYGISLTFTDWEKANKVTQKDFDDAFSLEWGLQQHNQNMHDAGIPSVGRISPSRSVSRSMGELLKDDAVNEVTSRLQGHVSRATQKVDALGDAAFTQKQLQAIDRVPSLRPMYRGNRIDVMARKEIIKDPDLLHLKSNYRKGPDFVDPQSGSWWDITTPDQWQNHVNRYGLGGKLLKTK